MCRFYGATNMCKMQNINSYLFRLVQPPSYFLFLLRSVGVFTTDHSNIQYQVVISVVGLREVVC